MSRSVARELTRDERMQVVVKNAMEDGWSAELTAGGHIKFTHPLVNRVVFGPSTPSDYRSTKNAEAELGSVLKQSMETFDRLGKDREYAKTLDAAAKERGDDTVFYNCPACLGNDKKKTFVKAEALAAHMAKEHPAPKLEPKPKPVPDEGPGEPEPKPKEATVRKRKTVDVDPEVEKEALDSLTELFEDYYRARPNKPFNIDDVIKDLKLPNSMRVRKGVANRALQIRKRQEKKPWLNRNGHLEVIGRGRYAYVVPTELDSAPDEVKTATNVTNVTNTTEGPTEKRDPVVPSGRLYEWVAETSDGRHIVKDDQGKVYFATFSEI